MSDVFAKDFKILVLDLPNLPTDGLGNVVIHCSNYCDLQNALIKYHSSTIIIACCSNKLIGLDKLLFNYPIDTLYVVNDKKDEDIREWLYGFIWNNTIELLNEKRLMRHLCTKTMLCYYKQSIEYRNKDNNGMANLCIHDSRNALNYSTNFI